LSNQLQLKKSKFPIAVSGIGDSGITVEYTIDVTIKSIHNDYTNTITASIIPTITERQPNTTFSTSQWNIPDNIKLADPSFNTSRRIDLLIGASIFFDLLCVGQLRLKEPTHILQKTRLGWIVSGGKQGSIMNSSCAVASKLVESNEPHKSLDQLVRGFWETENCLEGTTKVKKEEFNCEMHFQANYCRLDTGEYSVRLPVKQGINLLGDSYQHALRRLISLERRLQRNDNVRSSGTACNNTVTILGNRSSKNDSTGRQQMHHMLSCQTQIDGANNGGTSTTG
ncbi:uncharacterized protein LOC118755897, partial [Rhagoletis pomonella]|uniref:uncharacterized protein LOC118755897 n=1 Tax=Rhagoletis pomonella TaxID=28610 RepID=UPI001780F143